MKKNRKKDTQTTNLRLILPYSSHPAFQRLPGAFANANTAQAPEKSVRQERAENAMGAALEVGRRLGGGPWV